MRDGHVHHRHVNTRLGMSSISVGDAIEIALEEPLRHRRNTPLLEAPTIALDLDVEDNPHVWAFNKEEHL